MNRKEEIKILTAIKDSEIPVGATYLSSILNISPASIGRKLLEFEEHGLLKKISNKGRVLTKEGIDYIEHQEQLEDKLSVAENIIVGAKEGSLESLQEIMMIRMLLEPFSVELACENVSDKALHELDVINMENLYVIKNGEMGNKQDLNFHLTIARESGNRTLFQILQLILTQDNAYSRISEVAPQVTIKQVEEHSKILDAIREHDPANAKKAMEEHLKRVISDIQNHYRQ